MPLSIATFQIGNYEVFKKRIGKGAFSSIYKAYNKYSKELVAVKEISLETLNKYEKSIKNETDIMKKLNHPYIVKLYDTIIDESTDNVYLIMEYMGRGDFSKYLNRRPLKEKYALKYLKQIAQAMKYLLDNNIIHRDLKPQNILISDTGNIKLTDFGFARYFDKDIMIQTICGSPLYMAPEIIKNKKYDYKSDLWSIGVIFYEMLMGEPPFKAKNIYQLIRQIENDKIDIPQKFKISSSCKILLLSLLEKNPEKRITWDEFFCHNLLKEKDPFEEENKLMEISSLESFPSVPQRKTNNEYNSVFITSNSHSSFYSRYKNRKMESKSNNLSIVPSKDSEYDMNLQFNFNLNNSIDESNNSSDNELYYDTSENFSELNSGHYSYNDDFVNLDLNEDYFKSSLSIKNDLMESEIVKDLRKNKLLKDYIVIKTKKDNNNSSFKNYLSNSVKFLKESYNYLSNYNSI